MAWLSVLLLTLASATASCPDGDLQDAPAVRGFFFAVADTSSTRVVTVTSTTTRLVTCTTTQNEIGPCRGGRQRALASTANGRAGITQTKSPWRDTKELQLQSSLESSPLFPKDHAALKKTCNTLTSSDPDGRVMLTLERVTFATDTKTEVVTVRDPRSTISITYDGCIPPDAIDTFECPDD
ncbi:uncharacterized protein [Penaeus vannamei]|uniref:uncharacterized protein n=1 Tax=Penaeus vannamei TaxID=6689 RepID=UPI000F65A5F6|nr:uncharacterized protein LOC113800745 [Penaeus vannamei]